MSDPALEIPLPGRAPVYVRLYDLPDSDGGGGGRRARLAPPSAYVLRRIDAAERIPLGSDDAGNPVLAMEGLLAWYDVAEALLPELTREDVERLSSESIAQLVEVAKRPLDEQQRIAKNAAAPSAKAPRVSTSRTPSPTRSRGSRRATASDSAT